MQLFWNQRRQILKVLFKEYCYFGINDVHTFGFTKETHISLRHGHQNIKFSLRNITIVASWKATC